MDQIKDARLRSYSVWVPILMTDTERAVPNATTRLPDNRLVHFWDGKGELVEAYKTILPTKNAETGAYIKAWDVYLVFAPGIEWKDKPPTPSFWMHQLYSVDPKNAFDSKALATEIQRLLKQIMPCCAVAERQTSNAKTAHTMCTCGAESKRVSRTTLLSMLKPRFLDEVLSGTYRFCAARECPVVYFEERGTRKFTVDDLRIVVGVKASIDPIPLCYCFGFDETHLREEIVRTGSTTIPQRISHLIRAGLCACDLRNPSGGCCLGEVNKATMRLKQQVVQSI